MDDQEIKRQQRKKDKPLSTLDRLILGTIADDIPLGHEDDQAATLYPTLWEWLTRTTAGRDHVMMPATVGIAAVAGGFNVTINHRGLNQSFAVVTPNLDQWAAVAEAYLTGPSPIFRSFGRGQPKVKKRRQTG